MWNELRDRCKEVVDWVIKEPLANIFLSPYRDSDPERMKAYHDMIPHPMDLNTVKTKLRDNEYPCFQSWADDMIIIFDNAILFNREASFVGGIASYFKKKVTKKIHMIRLNNPRNYEDTVMKLMTQIRKHMEAFPGKLPETTIKELPHDYTKESIETLLTKLSTITDPDLLAQVKQIIIEGDGDVYVKGNTIIDLAKSSRKVLINLEKFCSDNSIGVTKQ